MGAIVWDLFTWWFINPKFSSHALIGERLSVQPSSLPAHNSILWAGVIEGRYIPLLTSPLIGMTWSCFIMKMVFEIFADWPPKKANGHFHAIFRCFQLRLWHIATAIMTQKTMGIITLALVTVGLHDPSNGFHSPPRSSFSATTMALKLRWRRSHYAYRWRW